MDEVFLKFLFQEYSNDSYQYENNNVIRLENSTKIENGITYY